MRAQSAARAQKGSVLLVAVIFLVIFTLLAITIFRGATTSIQTIGNMQWRAEATAAANVAIDSLLSDATTFTAPQTSYTFSYDANGDGNADISVTTPAVTHYGKSRGGPRCVRFSPVPPNQLDLSNAQDRSCFGSAALANPGLSQAIATGTATLQQFPPLCANSEWSLTVRATDAVTNTVVDVVQGVGVRVPTTSVITCD
jgi:hypothetical protein